MLVHSAFILFYFLLSYLFNRMLNIFWGFKEYPQQLLSVLPFLFLFSLSVTWSMLCLYFCVFIYVSLVKFDSGNVVKKKIRINMPVSYTNFSRQKVQEKGLSAISS